MQNDNKIRLPRTYLLYALIAYLVAQCNGLI